MFAFVEQERRVGGCHYRAVGDHPDDPAVEADDEIEEAARVLAVGGQRDRGDEDEDPDQAGEERVFGRPGDPGAAAEEAAIRYCGMPASQAASSDWPLSCSSG